MDEQHEVWETWAQADPLWAILSDPAKRGGRWGLTEFFASGPPDVDEVLQQVAALGPSPEMGRSLDFGCGVGRLSRALAAHFDRVDGVDISETMVQLADRYNTDPERVTYHVNGFPDLRLFDAATFDFIFTTIVLQHNPPDIARRYIAEFIRVLRPNGVAVFDMTASLRGATLPEDAHRATLDVHAPSRMQPGELVCVPVTVTNTSGIDWPAGTRLAVGNHWLSTADQAASGQSVTQGGAGDGSTTEPMQDSEGVAPQPRMLIQDDGRAPLSDAVNASSSCTVTLPVTAPSDPGHYVLAVDLVEEGTCWFEHRGSPVARQPILVRRSRVRSLLGRRPWAPPQPSAEEPAPFAMNGLPKDDVLETVAASGGVLLGLEPSHRGGDHWDGYRYFVTTKDAADR